ncbi:MAG: ectoine utilization protein EutA [Mesorhizobium amorphae]|nr:MAG: ectoine utilization protein EutA [Mesorhizobium amorphae]
MKGPVEITLHPARLSLDERPRRRRVGLVVLATDHSSEPDFARMVASEGIAVHAARIPYANPTTPENLRKMQPHLSEGAALILPGETLDAVCFSCTSASVVIGDAAIEAAIRQAKPDAAVVTPPLAAAKGLRAMGARRISVLTPYTTETSRPMARYFTEKGFAIDRFTCLGLEDDREMARIRPDALVDLAREVTDPRSDALFISCTALRAAGAVPRIEQAIGRPAISSNQASAWEMLRICGEDASHPEWGHLMTLPRPAEERA